MPIFKRRNDDAAPSENIPSRRNFLFSALSAGVGVGLAAQAGAQDAAPDAAPAVIPAPPGRILLSASENPARLQRVTWRAHGPLDAPSAQILPMTPSPISGEGAQTVTASHMPFEPVPGTTTHSYSAAFTGLTPDTAYLYRVGGEGNWSAWNEFRTAPETPEKFRFLYMGDPQNDLRSQWSRTVRRAFRQVPDARFLLLAGDLVNHGFNDDQWDELTDAMGFIPASMAVLPTPGNHDTKRAEGVETPEHPYTASPTYHAHFSLPENGPAGVDCLKGEAYCADYMGVRVVSFNSNIFTDSRPRKQSHREVWDALLAWIEEVLKNNPNRWTVVTHHHPVYSGSARRDNKTMRDLLRPIYEKHGVDLVLQGHDHCYCRTLKTARDKVVAPDAPGVVYVVSVSGPKMYDMDPKFKALMADTMLVKTQLFHTIEVDGDSLVFDSHDTAGRRVDGFRLDKDASGASTLKETFTA